MKSMPARKRREDCFFGLHFDFHAKPADQGGIILIEGASEDMIHGIIDLVKPDYIQIDCKGHPGWSSYPSKAGNPYPRIKGDPLAVWRKATAERGVALFMHYSGVIDVYQCEEHPEWERKGIEGEAVPEWIPKGITSTFGPYVDEILIPQLMELAGVYEVDGVWIDGECWGTQIDYCEKAVEGFAKKTGIILDEAIPRKPGDANWQEYSDYCREQYRKYMKRYVDKVHAVYPRFQIASNWAYSSKMPEEPAAGVDFLSGDYLWADSVNSARYEGRCLAAQGKPWDLMAWGFRYLHGDKYERCPKHPEQLKQEAAVVMAMGGGFQSYYPQRKDGGIHMWQVRLMKEVSEFCREREPFCHKAAFIPQIAVLNSTYSRYTTSKYLFQCDGEDTALQGIVRCLCDAGQSFEIVSEHHLKKRMGEFPLIIVPETRNIHGDLVDDLLGYAKNGGSLWLIGTEPFASFKERLGYEGEVSEDEYLLSADGLTWAYNHGRTVMLPFDGSSRGKLAVSGNIDAGFFSPASKTVPYGRGLICLMPVNIGDIYMTRKSHVHRNLVREIALTLYDPVVLVIGNSSIDLTVMKKEGGMRINLVNTSGPHEDPDVFTYDEIASTGPFRLKVRLEKKPGRIVVEPKGYIPETTWDEEEKTLGVFIPTVDIHEIIAVD
ncbi:MAG: hypothetical protein JXB33_01915 [Clostridia bacterium]|nr:hypothetical protein [Clostridia bacterium]